MEISFLRLLAWDETPRLKAMTHEISASSAPPPRPPTPQSIPTAGNEHATDSCRLQLHTAHTTTRARRHRRRRFTCLPAVAAVAQGAFPPQQRQTARRWADSAISSHLAPSCISDTQQRSREFFLLSRALTAPLRACATMPMSTRAAVLRQAHDFCLASISARDHLRLALMPDGT
ncbi:unnamed protein product [Cercospora beticola]|nr:unnamed protein product [Cercospora beticola]